MISPFSSNHFELPKNLTFKEKPNSKLILEVYQLGKKIGELKAHTTYFHKSRLINVITQDQKKYKIKENELKNIFKKSTDPKIHHESEVDMLVKEFSENMIKKSKKVSYSDPSVHVDQSLKKTIKGRDISDRAVRDNLMKSHHNERMEKKGYGNLFDFEKTWKGQIDDKSLELAWSYQENLLKEIKLEWSNIRMWIKNQEFSVTVGNWESRKEDFLQWIGKDPDQFSSIFKFIDQNIKAKGAGKDTHIQELMDLILEVNKSESGAKASMVAFDDKQPKYQIPELEKLYKKLEHEQIFPIIQAYFNDFEILTCSQRDYENNKNQIYQQIIQLIDESNFEASELKELIREYDFLEKKLDRFIVKELRESLNKITFSSKNVKGVNQSVSDTREAIADFDEKCREFFYDLKKEYMDVNSPLLKLQAIHISGLSLREEVEIGMEKLFDYYEAKADQMKLYLQSNLNIILKQQINEQKQMTENEAAGGLKIHKLINHEFFQEEALKEAVSKEPKVNNKAKTYGITGGAFIQACRAPLYQPQETEKRLDQFFQFVEQQREKFKDLNIVG